MYIPLKHDALINQDGWLINQDEWLINQQDGWSMAKDATLGGRGNWSLVAMERHDYMTTQMQHDIDGH
jgi:hypothetical protein